MKKSDEKNYLIWNGCDGHRVANKGEKEYSITEEFEAFEVGEEVTSKTLPVDEDGELIFDGYYSTSCGKIFKELNK